MKKLVLAAVTALGIAAALPAFAADPLLGFWRTARDDNGNSGLIEVKPCGARMCGTLIKAFGPSGAEIASDNIGRKLIWNTVNKGGGIYRGRVYSPDRDAEYASRLVLTNGGKRLSVAGCRFGFCRQGGVWTKQ